MAHNRWKIDADLEHIRRMTTAYPNRSDRALELAGIGIHSDSNLLRKPTDSKPDQEDMGPLESDGQPRTQSIAKLIFLELVVLVAISILFAMVPVSGPLMITLRAISTVGGVGVVLLTWFGWFNNHKFTPTRASSFLV